MTRRRGRAALQITVAVLGLVPVSAGLAGVLVGPAFLGGGAGAAADFDSHFRYLSGIFLAVGLGFWSTVPRIETAGRRFRLLTLCVFVGGLARALSFALVGAPSWPQLVGLGLELVITPALALWQARVASGDGEAG